MKNITIVTVYNACNYGSFLQAYALKSAIENKGYDVNFLEMEVDEDKVIGVGSFSKEYIAFETKKYDKITAEQVAFKTVNIKDLNSDCCVLGSDTIWNMFDPAYANIPYFVGKDLPCKNIMSYAASVGQNNYYKILLTKLFKLLPVKKLNSIGVRDDKTERFVKFLGRKCTRVVDPTFLYDFEVEKPDVDIDGDYLLVYTYGMTDAEVSSIKEYSKKRNLKIVATGSLCEWADYNLSVGSFEWLWLVQNAKFVVTNTFHGTVFSIKYNKRFASYAKTSDKVISLLSEFALQERNCDYDYLEKTLDTDIDYTKVNTLIDEKKKTSLEYLYRGIANEH